MREARIKVDPSIGEAVYHCISRAVAAEHLFNEVAKEIFRRQLWVAADFCGVQVMTYAILSNHFHVVVRVPKKSPVPDEELLRRYRLLHDRHTRRERLRLSKIQALLAANGPGAESWRSRQLAQMGDLSAFMKKWKQRFSIWFNDTHRRIGTLWASRFTSLLVEPAGFASELVAAYTDLNAVRAGLVRDPKDYRFCGYAEAVSGSKGARAGLMTLYPDLGWNETHARYRIALFGIGADAREGKASIPYEEFRRVVREKGKLAVADVMLCRLRHFVHGGILGSRAFVQVQLAAYVERTHHRPRTAPRPLPGWANWGDLCVMRRVHQPEVA